jgi:hypothetical protein
MVYNKMVSSLRGRINGVEGWEAGELEGKNKRGGGGGGGGQEQVCYEFITHLSLSPRGPL